MKLYFLNSAVITAEGVYEYKILNNVTELQQAFRKLLPQADEVISRVGYKSTIQHIKQILNISLPLSREKLVMEQGDVALVIRLKYRVQDPKQKGELTPSAGDWEYGILRKR